MWSVVDMYDICISIFSLPILRRLLVFEIIFYRCRTHLPPRRRLRGFKHPKRYGFNGPVEQISPIGILICPLSSLACLCTLSQRGCIFRYDSTLLRRHLWRLWRRQRCPFLGWRRNAYASKAVCEIIHYRLYQHVSYCNEP